MHKPKWFVPLVLAVACAAVLPVAGMLGLLASATADAAPESVLPTMGQTLASGNVEVVNLTPVEIQTYGMALGHITLTYGEKCYMFKGAAFSAVGVDGQRVLVRSRVRGPHQLYDEGAPVCSGDVLFWIGYQQFLLSAQAYRKAESERLTKETARDRDRRIIRVLLDAELAKKP